MAQRIERRDPYPIPVWPMTTFTPYCFGRVERGYRLRRAARSQQALGNGCGYRGIMALVGRTLRDEGIDIAQRIGNVDQRLADKPLMPPGFHLILVENAA
jgi:hypothetical protein